MIDKYQYAMFAGEFYSKQSSDVVALDESPLIRLATAELPSRFVVRLGDHGFYPLGLHQGDHLIFRAQRWPTKELEICFCIIGNEGIIRMLDGVLSHDIALRVPRDAYRPIELTPQDFHVTGVLAGIIPRDESIQSVTMEDLYYGVEMQ